MLFVILLTLLYRNIGKQTMVLLLLTKLMKTNSQVRVLALLLAVQGIVKVYYLG
jgi:hypothetical protein